MKQAKLPDEIFNYIYLTNYQRFFFLGWYDNIIYASSKDKSIKSFINLFCNKFSCQSQNFNYLNYFLFINTTPVKYKEFD